MPTGTQMTENCTSDMRPQLTNQLWSACSCLRIRLCSTCRDKFSLVGHIESGSVASRTNHAYWNLKGHQAGWVSTLHIVSGSGSLAKHSALFWNQAGNVLDHVLMVAASRTTATDETLAITGAAWLMRIWGKPSIRVMRYQETMTLPDGIRKSPPAFASLREKNLYAVSIYYVCCNISNISVEHIGIEYVEFKELIEYAWIYNNYLKECLHSIDTLTN